MPKIRIVKIILLLICVSGAGLKLSAFPEYLKIFANHPSSLPELRTKCATCHVSPVGGGERNEFGKAFAAHGHKITPELRAQFANRFASSNTQQSPTFVKGSESEAVVEIGGKRYTVDLKTRSVIEVAENMGKASSNITSTEVAKAKERIDSPNVYQQGDVRLVNLPTGKRIEKGALYIDVTHRLPPEHNPSNKLGSLFGLDNGALPAFGAAYGITDRVHVGIMRGGDDLGQPILLYAGASLLDENKGHPFSVMTRIGIEGRENFRHDFTTTLEASIARSITSRAQLYFVPAVSFRNREISGPADHFASTVTTFAMGVGGIINLTPTVGLMGEANWRVNQSGRLGSA